MLFALLHVIRLAHFKPHIQILALSRILSHNQTPGESLSRSVAIRWSNRNLGRMHGLHIANAGNADGIVNSYKSQPFAVAGKRFDNKDRERSLIKQGTNDNELSETNKFVRTQSRAKLWCLALRFLIINATR